MAKEQTKSAAKQSDVTEQTSKEAKNKDKQKTNKSTCQQSNVPSKTNRQAD